MQDKLTIAFDLDDVLADFISAFLEWHNQRYNTNICIEDVVDYDLTKSLKLKNELQARNRVHEFFQSDEYIQIKPVEGAVEGIAELSKIYNLIIITSRPYNSDSVSVEELTLEWIHTYFGDSFSGIYFTNQYNIDTNPGDITTKNELCRENNVVLLVEDALHHVKNCLHILCYGAILYARPWNTSGLSGTPRVESWQELLAKIYELTEQKDNL
jgi:5'(3')-deoxyribonucleotidase